MSNSTPRGFARACSLICAILFTLWSAPANGFEPPPDKTSPLPQCGNATAWIASPVHAAPLTGSARPCSIDRDCPRGEYCSYRESQQNPVCRGAGSFQREDKVYVAGRMLDVALTIPQCARVTGASMGGIELGGGDLIEGDSPGDWELISSTSTVVDGVLAQRQTVRLHFFNHGEGASFPMEISVGTSNGSVASHRFTLVAVDAVDAPVVLTMGETKLRNDYLVAIYEKFGDTGLMGENGARLAYKVDWRALSDDPGSHVGTDIRVRDGFIAFALGFTTDLPVCDGPGRVWGSFTLVPDPLAEGVLRLHWLQGPAYDVNAATHCALGSLGLSELIIAGGKIVKEILEDTTDRIRENFESGFGFPGGMRQFPFTRFLSADIGNGRVDVHMAIGVPHVRIKTTSAYMTDRTHDVGYGMAVPFGVDVLLVTGGLYESRIYPYAPDPAEAGVLRLDSGGAFNWAEDETVPVPNPWESPSGQAAYYPERHAVWKRLKGLVRDPAEMPVRLAPAGALLARMGNIASLGSRHVAAGLCVMPSRSLAQDRLLVGINDDPQINGAAPHQGSLGVSVFIPDSPGESQVYFEGIATCPVPPTTTSQPVFRTYPSDWDGDAILDAFDNCPVWANDQRDTDGNGLGDACECGDQSGDGRVTIQDLIEINRAIFSPGLATPLCDTNGDERCDVGDIAGANARIFGAPAHCSRNPGER
jgi:hypothetical protein